MKNTKRTVTGLLFAATLALSLTAGGSDAYAKLKPGGGHSSNSGGDITSPRAPAEVFETLGITWE